ncbi:MAG: nucleoside deaminase [Candidatus Omnitrophica bacterium]|nr:nucleoside deaminase [Candidatus Omnitrophota bacterium]
MRAAIRSAQTGMSCREGGPFGAAIVKSGRLIAVAHNTVLKNQDATAHAEINAIRIASRKLKSFSLKGCVIYSTTEPCPMCFAAIHWARIDRIIFGTQIHDVQKRGFNELSIPAVRMKKSGKSPVKITSGFMREECLELLQRWDGLDRKRLY